MRKEFPLSEDGQKTTRINRGASRHIEEEAQGKEMIKNVLKTGEVSVPDEEGIVEKNRGKREEPKKTEKPDKRSAKKPVEKPVEKQATTEVPTLKSAIVKLEGEIRDLNEQYALAMSQADKALAFGKLEDAKKELDRLQKTKDEMESRKETPPPAEPVKIPAKEPVKGPKIQEIKGQDRKFQQIEDIKKLGPEELAAYIRNFINNLDPKLDKLSLEELKEELFRISHLHSVADPKILGWEDQDNPADQELYKQIRRLSDLYGYIRKKYNGEQKGKPIPEQPETRIPEPQKEEKPAPEKTEEVKELEKEEPKKQKTIAELEEEMEGLQTAYAPLGWFRKKPVMQDLGYYVNQNRIKEIKAEIEKLKAGKPAPKKEQIKTKKKKSEEKFEEEPKKEKEASEEFSVGDWAMWESQGVDQWPEPKEIIAIREHEELGKKFAFFEDSDVGIPIEQLKLIKKSEKEGLIYKLGKKIREQDLKGFGKKVIDKTKKGIEAADKLGKRKKQKEPGLPEEVEEDIEVIKKRLQKLPAEIRKSSVSKRSVLEREQKRLEKRLKKLKKK